MQSRNEQAPASPAREPVATDPWSQLAQARTAEQLCQAWLPVLCGLLSKPHSGLLLLQGLSEIIKRVAYLQGHYEMDTHYEKPVQ